MRIAPVLMFCPTLALAGPDLTADRTVFASITAGVVCSGEDTSRAPAPDTRLGFIDLVEGPIYVGLPTRRIPAIPGLAFGVVGTAAPSAAAAEVTVTITHPPMGSEGSTREAWTSSLVPEGLAANFFTFDYPEERVPGLWTMQATLEGRVLYTAQFEVVDPALWPDFVDPCEQAPQIS